MNSDIGLNIAAELTVSGMSKTIPYTKMKDKTQIVSTAYFDL